MCGFLTEFKVNDSILLSKEEVFKDLLSLSKHRGPDSTEVLIGSNFQLGFNRLAILDLSEKGNQPIISPSGRYKVVFNGELYNFKNLVSTYEINGLRSSSDSEVLVHLIDKLGVEDSIKVLNGMFAIVIVDVEIQKIYLARDFAGIKPLFYGVHENGLISASQFNQVFKHPWFRENLKLSAQALKDYLGFGYMQAPNTVFKTIYQVLPGELVTYTMEGEIQKKELVSFRKEASYFEAMNTKEFQDNLQLVLEGAVEKQLISDVPLATFLSGGIDSPLISALAKKHKPDIHAFTVSVGPSEMNEGDQAEAYAKDLNIFQETHVLEADDILKWLDDHFKAFSEPFGDYSSLPTFMITKAAKGEHTVMLSGDGGDELFFGYPRMLDVLRKRFWFFFPRIIRSFIVRVTNRLGLTHTWSPLFRRFDDFVMNKHLYLSHTILDTIVPNTKFSTTVQKAYRFSPWISRKKLLHSLRYNEFYNHLQRVLIKVDRASMANSLEVRVPFLDRDVIDLAWGGYVGLHYESDLKSPLKKMLRGFLKRNQINEKKKGFTVPLEDWLHKDLKEDVMKTLFSETIYGHEILDLQAVRNYVSAYYEKKHSNAWGIWHLYAWQKWANQEGLS